MVAYRESRRERDGGTHGSFNMCWVSAGGKEEQSEKFSYKGRSLGDYHNSTSRMICVQEQEKRGGFGGG